MPKIFDFDQTISYTHTFYDRCIEKATTQTLEQQYVIGKTDASRNIKIGIEEVFIHEDKDLCSIATYHNNPDYIAGYVAKILGKELTLVHSKQSKEDPVIAINYYAVEGLETPFLVCYLPHQGERFVEVLKALKNKNKQITYLRDALIELELLNDKSLIDFYEDSQVNFEEAKQLHYINSHYVNRGLVFKLIDRHTAPAAATSETTPISSLVERRNNPVKDNKSGPELVVPAAATPTPNTTPYSSPEVERRNSPAALRFFDTTNSEESVAKIAETAEKLTISSTTGN